MILVELNTNIGCIRLASLGRPRCGVFFVFPGRTWAHNYPTFVLEKSPILFSSTNVCKCSSTLHLETTMMHHHVSLLVVTSVHLGSAPSDPIHKWGSWGWPEVH